MPENPYQPPNIAAETPEPLRRLDWPAWWEWLIIAALIAVFAWLLLTPPRVSKSRKPSIITGVPFTTPRPTGVWCVGRANRRSVGNGGRKLRTESSVVSREDLPW
jgi:hypothetical protein